MNKQEAIEKQIDDIMDTFDFRGACEMLSAYVKDNPHYPKEWVEFEWEDGGIRFLESELRSSARDRLRSAIKHGQSSGAYFSARYEEGDCDEDDGRPWVWLNLYFGLYSGIDGQDYEKEGKV